MQVAANPFTNVATFHRELVAWDDNYHAREAAACTDKWRMRNQFINDHIAPLLGKVHDRQVALAVSIARWTPINSVQGRQSVIKLEAALECAHAAEAAALRALRTAEAAAQRTRNGKAAAIAALDAEVRARKECEAKLAEREQREAIAAQQQKHDGHARLLVAEARAHEREVAVESLRASNAIKDAAVQALAGRVQANLAETDRQRAAAASASKRAEDAESAALAAQNAEAAAIEARQQDAAAYRTQLAEAEKQRRCAQLAALQARIAETGALNALEVARRPHAAFAAEEWWQEDCKWPVQLLKKFITFALLLLVISTCLVFSICLHEYT